MAAILKRFPRSNNAGIFSVIHHWRKISACRSLCFPNNSNYSTESATSAAEEFSLRYLDGKHEGKLDVERFFVSKATDITSDSIVQEPIFSFAPEKSLENSSLIYKSNRSQ